MSTHQLPHVVGRTKLIVTKINDTIFVDVYGKPTKKSWIYIGAYVKLLHPLTVTISLRRKAKRIPPPDNPKGS